MQTRIPLHSHGMLDRAVHNIQRAWLAWVNIVLGVLVILPLLAPVLMEIGAVVPARAIYFVYSALCHQLPERSYFFFGQHPTYSIALFTRLVGSDNPFVRRQFIGNAELGYKTGWSDRMISLYTSVWLGGVICAVLRGRLRAWPLALVAALIAPLVIDGMTHAVSDLWGIGHGFRDDNDWLRTLTNNMLPSSFYVGDGWGSFNSLMRLTTGVLSGFAVAFGLFLRLDRWIKA